MHFFVRSIKIYYHQGECVVILGRDSRSREDLTEIICRLENLSKGCETQRFTLARNDKGQLGFHVQQDGVVTEIEPTGCSAKSGLIQGSRLVEVKEEINF